MSIVYEGGVLCRIRFADEPEVVHKPHWYEVGTRFIFTKAVNDNGQAIAVQVAATGGC
jgi:hypothetical protein